ncbi:hypothetical protein NN561_000458 [Cricetulus griseus]
MVADCSRYLNGTITPTHGKASSTDSFPFGGHRPAGVVGKKNCHQEENSFLADSAFRQLLCVKNFLKTVCRLGAFISSTLLVT